MGHNRFLAQCREYGLLDMTLEDAARIRDGWFKAWPEMKRFMDIKPYFDTDGNPRYRSTTFTGRTRTGCSFNSALNLMFQGPASDGAKMAGVELQREIDGVEPVIMTARPDIELINFVHDEYLTHMWESDVDTLLPAVERIMVSAMKKVMTHMNIEVESAVMRRWTKEAKLVRDKDGRIKVWEPAQDKVIDLREALESEQDDADGESDAEHTM